MPRKGLAALPSDGRVLSTYTPTLRERMADALRRTFYSDDRAGQQQAEKVMNYAEAVTPVGLATGMYDAGQNAGRGNYGLAALQLGMAGIPGPNPKMNPEFSAILKAASERKAFAADLAKNNSSLKMIHGDGRSAMVGPDMSKPGMFRFTRFDNAGPVGHTEHQSFEEAINEALREHYSVKNEKPKGIRAFHGSPHDFDRFDLSKIGTGEGAQAYGHGLYFADSENVAKSYRDNLLGRGTIMSGKADNLPDRWQMAVFEAMKKPAGDIRDSAIAMLRAKVPPEYSDQVNALLDNKGHMYEVNIDADPNSLLDWDKPLSEQSDAVRTALQNAALVAPEPKAGPAKRNRAAILAGDGNVPGDILYNNIGGFSQPSIASNTLREAGVPGIKYLDAGSRAKGDGSRNYVMFDDKLVKIIRKYGLAALLPAGAYAAQQPTDAQAATP